MKREIKFRAWNNKFKEFKFMSLVNYLGGRGILDDWADSEHSVWEQYTGLKDKIGVEIYENDILKSVGGNTEVVIYIDGRFEPVCWYDDETYEVIGNIHENADLLEEEK